MDWLGRLAGRFLVLDGPDGSGKSTQLSRLVDACRAAGVEVEVVREPGGTPIGERVREILLDNRHGEMDLRCEMLLYMASRAQLVHERVEPALKRGALVIADRFVSATLAYQGAAGGLPERDIRAVAEVAVGEGWPDLVIIFDVDEATAASRRKGKLDRIESKGADYHRRVREGFLAQAKSDPAHHLVVDARGDADAVFAQLIAGLRARLG